MVKMPVLFKRAFISSYEGRYFSVAEGWNEEKWYMIKISDIGEISIVSFDPTGCVVFGGGLECIAHIKDDKLCVIGDVIKSMKIFGEDGVYRSSIVELLKKRKAFLYPV